MASGFARRTKVPGPWPPLRDGGWPSTGRGPRTRPEAVLADRAYATGPIRKHLRGRGIKTVIPEKKDSVLYNQRNVVERSFALTKQWRGLATRYDKLAITHRAATILSACLIWSRHIRDTP